MIKKFLFISTLLLVASLTHPNSVICFAMKCTSLLRDTGTCRSSTSISSVACSLALAEADAVKQSITGLDGGNPLSSLAAFCPLFVNGSYLSTIARMVTVIV